MPALANLAILDSTAAARTFNVESSGSNNAGIFTWKNRTSAVPVRYEEISYSNKRARGSNLLVHHYKLILPVTDTPSGGLERKVAQVMMDARIYMPDNATLLQRQNFWAYAKNFGMLTEMASVVINSESFY